MVADDTIEILQNEDCACRSYAQTSTFKLVRHSGRKFCLCHLDIKRERTEAFIIALILSGRKFNIKGESYISSWINIYHHRQQQRTLKLSFTGNPK